MLPTASCPHCQRTVSYVMAEHIEVRRGPGQMPVHGVSYVCPSCSKVLSVQADPLVMLNDAVARIERAVKKAGL
jgi:hypothetical protein